MIHKDFWSPILFCVQNFSFIRTRYHHSFCLGMEFFWNWILSRTSFCNRLLEKPADCQPRIHELYTGVRGPGKFLKDKLSETPYPAFPGRPKKESCHQRVKVNLGTAFFFFSLETCLLLNLVNLYRNGSFQTNRHCRATCSCVTRYWWDFWCWVTWHPKPSHVDAFVLCCLLQVSLLN